MRRGGISQDFFLIAVYLQTLKIITYTEINTKLITIFYMRCVSQQHALAYPRSHCMHVRGQYLILCSRTLSFMVVLDRVSICECTYNSKIYHKNIEGKGTSIKFFLKKKLGGNNLHNFKIFINNTSIIIEICLYLHPLDPQIHPQTSP